MGGIHKKRRRGNPATALREFGSPRTSGGGVSLGRACSGTPAQTTPKATTKAIQVAAAATATNDHIVVGPTISNAPVEPPPQLQPPPTLEGTGQRHTWPPPRSRGAYGGRAPAPSTHAPWTRPHCRWRTADGRGERVRLACSETRARCYWQRGLKWAQAGLHGAAACPMFGGLTARHEQGVSRT